MGHQSQLASLLSHIRPDAMESILDSYFDAFWEDLLIDDESLKNVADMPPAEKIILFASFISQDGPDGEMIRDIFFNLVANNGGDDWVKRVAEIAEE